MIDVLPEISDSARQLQERYGVRTLAISANVTDYQAMRDAAQKIRVPGNASTISPSRPASGRENTAFPSGICSLKTGAACWR